MSESIPYGECAVCKNLYDVDNMEYIKTVGYVCEKCAIENFCMCDKCGKSFIFEDMYCNDTCRNCFEGRKRFRPLERNDYKHY